MVTIDLNVLNHLGINLYSNIPAVLSEVVANSWDADARNVDIAFDDDSVTIKDDGCGMTKSEINGKFLTVGYQKRVHGDTVTPLGRPVMGRKGIGKLSLFSIANTIEVASCKDNEKSGCILDVNGIREAIESDDGKTYYPPPLPEDYIDLTENGTKIIIRDFKRNFTRTPEFLKKKIARRFGIIGSEHEFRVTVNGEEVSIADRDYFHKLQYFWGYGSEREIESYIGHCNARGNQLEYDGTDRNGGAPSIEFEGESYPITGWIGTVSNSGQLKDPDGDESLNKIVIMVRGKLAQENILEEFAEGRVFSKYLIGEINADFLDLDEKDDIATSNRQEIIKDDPRYQLVKDWIKRELNKIGNKWTTLRNEGATKKALEVEPIKKWFDTLDNDQKKYAKSFFGKIDTLGIDDDAAKKQLYKNGIIAFESLKYQHNLSKLDSISSDNFGDFIKLFEKLDDIEAARYYQIVEGRVSVVEKFEELVDDDVIEKTLQEYIYDHLWLLDPSWERGTENPHMEESVATEFKDINAELTDEEKDGRVDIRYKEVTGKHVIVELKRSSVKIDSNKLAGQVTKYKTALIKLLEGAGIKAYDIEIYCILGRRCTNWINHEEEIKSRRSLKEQDITVLYYKELIKNANDAYKKYLQGKQEVRKLSSILKEIDDL